MTVDVNSRMGYIMGCCIGDGYIIPGKCMGLIVKDKDFIEEFKRNIDLICGREHNIWKQRTKERKFNNYILPLVELYHVCCGHKETTKKFSDLVDSTRSKEWKIPPFIWENTDNAKYSFLKGLFDSDSCVAKRSITLYSSNYDGLKEVVKLLSELKIGSKLGKRDDREDNYYLGIYGWKNMYLFYNEIGFSIKRKREKLKREVYNKKFTRCHTHEEVMKAKKLKESGLGCRRIERKLGIDASLINYWFRSDIVDNVSKIYNL